MMYGQGKSDGPIVPGKPPNKPAGAGAEGVEGRGPAKGNPQERTMRRTQGRERMQQALARVRQERDNEGRDNEGRSSYFRII